MGEIKQSGTRNALVNRTMSNLEKMNLQENKAKAYDRIMEALELSEVVPAWALKEEIKAAAYFAGCGFDV